MMPDSARYRHACLRKNRHAHAYRMGVNSVVEVGVSVNAHGGGSFLTQLTAQAGAHVMAVIWPSAGSFLIAGIVASAHRDAA